MRYVVLFVLLLSGIRYVSAQDAIILKNGDRIESKVLGVENGAILYTTEQDSLPVLLPISGALGIHYADNTIVSFKDSVEVTGDTPPHVSLYQQGVNDAASFYTSNDLMNKTRFATLVITPFVGFIPALICSSVRPSHKNLHYPNPDIVQNSEYKKGFCKKAHHIKAHDAWAGYGKGTRQWFNAIGNAIMYVITLPSTGDSNASTESSGSGSSYGPEKQTQQSNQGNAPRPSQNTPKPPPPTPAPTLQPAKKPDVKQK